MRTARPIYLDHHATTPVDPRVLAVMLPYFTERFGNAASRQHAFGWEAADAVDQARKQVAALMGASAREIVFTSGATESNNLALKGVAAAGRDRRDHIVTAVTEHHSVLDACRRLETEGWRVSYLPVDADGLLRVEDVAAAITDRTALVSVMTANNEIGVLQPIKAIAALAHERGALVHTDAVQALGKVPFDVDAHDVDLASVTAHKVYGPKGVGVLFVRRRDRRVTLRPLFDGGGHERAMRSGTLNVAGIVGFGAACTLAADESGEEAARLGPLRDRLLSRLRRALDGVMVNGSLEERLPGNLNVSFDGVDGEALLVSLTDVAVSSGAACTAAEPSHVLKALGCSPEVALASLRFGLGRWTTETQVDHAATHVAEAVTRLRAMAA